MSDRYGWAMRRTMLALGLVLSACGSATAALPTPTATPSYLFLPRCTSSVRPQADLDFAGLPPFVPSRGEVDCLLNASSGGSAYDAGYDASIRLPDGRTLHLYERRGGISVKPTPQGSIVAGLRNVDDATWTWTVLPGPIASLTNTVSGTYVELDLPGDTSQLDALAAIATGLRPVESLPRPPASEICAALRVSAGPSIVAAAFDSTAAAVARWFETPQTPDGPHELSSDWRRHAPSEPVAVCYLDGDFGPAKHPPLPSTATEPPNWSRVLYLVGVDRRPIATIFGWRDRIALVDPGR